MAEHYYTNKPTSGHAPRMIKEELLGRLFTFETDAGVFSRDEIDFGTRVLVKSLPPLKGRVLDLGCGWGASGIPAAAANPECEILSSDVNERAVELANRNIRANGLSNIKAVVSDGFENITGEFSVIYTNPPIRAGKNVIYSLFRGAKEHLVPGGALYIVIRKQQGAPSALKFLKEEYSSAEVIEHSGGYWVIRAVKE